MPDSLYVRTEGGKSPFTEGIGAPLMLVDKRGKRPEADIHKVYSVPLAVSNPRGTQEPPLRSIRARPQAR